MKSFDQALSRMDAKQAVATLATLAIGAMATATAAAQDFAGTDTKVCGFFDNVNGLLNIASVAVVTIAVIFAGYQIAFAHKRIADVAPILIGGLLIGAAGQIAKMLIGDTGESCGAAAAMLVNALPMLHA
jgi:type IV secretion system protein VirB2